MILARKWLLVTAVLWASMSCATTAQIRDTQQARYFTETNAMVTVDPTVPGPVKTSRRSLGSQTPAVTPLMKIYLDTGPAMKHGKPFALYMNPQFGLIGNEIARGKHNEELRAVAEITHSVGVQFYRPVRIIDNAVAICKVSGAKIAIRIDPWKSSTLALGPVAFTEEHKKRLDAIKTHAAKWKPYADHVAAIIINHEAWVVTPKNERAIRRKLDMVNAVFAEFLPDALIIHYNYRQRRAHMAKEFAYLPANLSTEFRGASLYFDRYDQAFQTLDATMSVGVSVALTAPTIPWLCLEASWLFDADADQWFQSPKRWIPWAHDYPRGDLFIRDVAYLLRDTPAVTAAIIYSPRILNEPFAHRLRILVDSLRGTGISFNLIESGWQADTRRDCGDIEPRVVR